MGLDAQRVEVAVLSALTYWSDTARGGIASPLIASLELPGRGVVLVDYELPNRSLLWVDGLVTHARATGEFIDCLQRGDIPAPLTSASPLPSKLRIAYISPESVMIRGQSIISIVGSASTLLTAARESTEVQCTGCGAAVPLFLRPIDLATQIHRDTAHTMVSVFFEGPISTLRPWAEQFGAQEHSATSDIVSVRINSGHSNESLTARLIPALRSAWGQQSLKVVVEVESATRQYSPHGICSQCGEFALRRDGSRIARLIQRGLDATVRDAPECEILVRGHSLGELLATSVAELPEIASTAGFLPSMMRRALVRLGLGHVALGHPVSSCTTSELALLTFLGTMNQADDSAVAIVDLPHGLLQAEQAQELASLTEDFGRSHPVILVGHAPWTPSHIVARKASVEPSASPIASMVLPHGPSGPPLLFSIMNGPCILPSQASQDHIFRVIRAAQGNDTLVRQALQIKSDKKISLFCAPVFEELSDSRLLIEVLGLYEAFSRLCTTSVDAKSLGLTSKALSLRNRTGPQYSCPTCRGVGLLLTQENDEPRPLASPCPTCDGMRFREPVSTLLFRGRTPGQLLNLPVSDLEALLNALPGGRFRFDLLRHLGLCHLPLGMPIPLLSFSERRRLQILQAAAAGSSARPSVAFVDFPFAGLSEIHAHAVQSILETPSMAPNTSWVFAA